MREACPTDAELAEVASRPLEAARLARMERHLDDCEACRRRLDHISGAGLADLPLSVLSNGEKEGLPPPLIEVVSAFLDPPSREGTLGRFGPYDVLSVIARGGMGIVLRAHDPALRRSVAVKVLAPELAADPRARERFLREARAAAAIHHDNVIDIHAVSEASGLPYLVMPLIDGPNLEEHVRQHGALAPGEVLMVGRQLARGLEAAHARGLIHRDIKPANVLLQAGLERIRIADFGLARDAGDPGLPAGSFIAGTPQFMSPEQARGEPLDHRADLFSVGCLLYFLATGRPPFEGDSVASILKTVAEADPRPVAELDPRIPRGLAQIINRLLSKHPEDRHRDAAELRSDLERVAALLAGAPSTGKRWRRWLGWSAAALLAGVLCAAAITLFYQQETRAPAQSEQPAMARAGGPFTVESSNESFASLAEAAARAASGDVILISGGDILQEPLAFSGKSLTLRAAPGSRPNLIFTSAARPALATDAPLALEGLTLRQDLPTLKEQETIAGAAAGTANNNDDDEGEQPIVPPLIRSDRSTLRLTHCRVIRTGPGRVAGPIIPCIELVGGARLGLIRCEIFCLLRSGGGVEVNFGGALGGAPLADASGEIAIQDSLIVAAAAVKVRRSVAVLDLKIVRSTIVGRGTLLVYDASSFHRVPGRPAVNVAAERSFFNGVWLMHTKLSSLEEHRDLISWKDSENVFAISERYLASPFVPLSSSPSDVKTWESFWGQESRSKSAPLRFRIAYQRVAFLPERLSIDQYLRQATRLSELDQVGAPMPIGPGAAFEATLKR